MILDGQNYFSNLANGDSPTAIADNASGNVIDQQVNAGLFTGPGGARIAPWLISRVSTLFATSASGTIQAVLQDSPDNVTWTDRILGSVIAAASATAGSDLLNVRLKVSMARYLRVVYRIATGVMTAGTAISFLTLEQDIVDLSQRKATGTVAEPSNAMDESVAQGILNQ